jgi:hypothetical protein
MFAVSTDPEHPRKPASTPLPGRFTPSNYPHDFLKTHNIYVSAVNHGFDGLRYLDAIPGRAVREIHLAGFDSNGMCLIDTHGKPLPARYGTSTARR